MVFRSKLLLLLLTSTSVAQGPASTSSSDKGAVDREAIAALERRVQAALKSHARSVVAIAVYRRRKAVSTWPPAIAVDPAGLRPALVSESRGEPIPVGTGIVLDAKGLILTNNHLLGRDDEDYAIDHFVIAADRQRRLARVKAADPRSDLAVLEIVPTSGATASLGLTGTKLGDADVLSVGQFVVRLGNPFAIVREGSPAAGWAMIAGLNRKGEARLDDFSVPALPMLHRYGTLIELDGRIAAGASGGMILNLDGEFVGLTTSLATLVGHDSTAGYAIPINGTFRRVVKALREGREIEYGMLGVAPTPNDRMRADSFLVPDRRLPGRSDDRDKPGQALPGVGVEQVIRGSPADAAGLSREDRLTHVNDRALRDPDDLILTLHGMPPGQRVRLGVLRRESPRSVEVVLAKFPPHPDLVITERERPWRGLRVDYPSAAIDVRQAYEIPAAGVAVTEVEPGSVAWNAGLRRGAIILEVRNKAVDSPRQFREQAGSLAGTVEIRYRTGASQPMVASLAERP